MKSNKLLQEEDVNKSKNKSLKDLIEDSEEFHELQRSGIDVSGASSNSIDITTSLLRVSTPKQTKRKQASLPAENMHLLKKKKMPTELKDVNLPERY